MSALRVVFFGTPEIAVPTLENLIAGPHEVVGIVSQPDRRRGRGRKESPSPVSEVALREEIPLLRPEKVGSPEMIERLTDLRPDVGIVVAFGQFLPKKVRELPSCGYLINAHASLLPKYRGASPIAQAILDGEAETGVSVMRVDREMDAGPVARVVRTAIGEQENTAELTKRLGRLASQAIANAVDSIAAGEIEWTEQDASLATTAPKLEKADSVLDFRESAEAVACRIHALSPKPGGSLTLILGEGGSGSGSDKGDGSGSDRAASERFEPVVIKISRAEAVPFELIGEGFATSEAGAGTTPNDSVSAKPEPGAIDLATYEVPIRVATGDGWLIPLVLQRAGGKALPAADFLRGFTIPDGARCALPASGDSTPRSLDGSTHKSSGGSATPLTRSTHDEKTTT